MILLLLAHAKASDRLAFDPDVFLLPSPEVSLPNIKMHFAAIPLLVSFIPMLMDTGGNCGSQSSTLIIRGIALGEIRFSDLFRVMFKEFRVSLIVGVVLALANGLRILIMYQKCRTCSGHWTCLWLLLIVISKLIGCLLTIVCKKTAYGSGHYGIPADHNSGRHLFHFDLFQYCDTDIFQL